MQVAVRARGRAARRRRPGTTQSESSQPYGSPASSMPRNATCSPSGDHATALQEPARRASSTGSPPRARDGVDGGCGIDVGALAAVGAERDARPVGRPREALDRPVAAREAARSRARRARPARRGACGGRRCPSPSSRQSARVTTRASGAPAARRAGRRRSASRARRPRARGACRPARAGTPLTPWASAVSTLGLAARERHLPRPGRRAGRARARRARRRAATESRTSPEVSARALPPSSGDDPDVPPVAVASRRAPRVDGVLDRRARRHGSPRAICAEHERARRRRHPAGQHTAGHQPDHRDPARRSSSCPRRGGSSSCSARPASRSSRSPGASASRGGARASGRRR